MKLYSLASRLLVATFAALAMEACSRDSDECQYPNYETITADLPLGTPFDDVVRYFEAKGIAFRLPHQSFDDPPPQDILDSQRSEIWLRYEPSGVVKRLEIVEFRFYANGTLAKIKCWHAYTGLP